MDQASLGGICELNHCNICECFQIYSCSSMYLSHLHYAFSSLLPSLYYEYFYSPLSIRSLTCSPLSLSMFLVHYPPTIQFFLIYCFSCEAFSMFMFGLTGVVAQLVILDVMYIFQNILMSD